MIKFISETLLPTHHGEFTVKAYRDDSNNVESIALIVGDVSNKDNVKTRIHDQCITSEVFGSLKCDCNDQLIKAMQCIQKNKSGIIIYLNQEGRGIGLANKIAAYKLQESGYDTVEANRELNLPDDCREYKAAAFILNELNIKSIQLMTNNPRKISELKKEGIKISSKLPLITKYNNCNSDYINTKIQKMGHTIDEDKLSDEQLENVAGGMSYERFDLWRARTINEDW
jgi:3,4-dihydroxy 2-butanone 4-phosphate synthase / GTP cyclohydrolase II